jgi:hypothetical protein
MKSISASLVILSGALILLASTVGNGLVLKDITFFIGCGTMLIGLIAWCVTLFRKD